MRSAGPYRPTARPGRRRYRTQPIALDDLNDELVARLLARAHPREREVLTAVYLDGLGLAEVGARMGITESRVCQIVKEGAARIRAAWTTAARAPGGTRTPTAPR